MHIAQASFNLSIGILILSPCLHDERVVDRDAHDLVDALSLQVSSSLNIPGQVGLAAARGESSWHPEDNNLAHTTLTFATDKSY